MKDRYVAVRLDWDFGWVLSLSKHEFLIHAGTISAKTAELKAKEAYKKYKDLNLYNISKVEKDYIKALEDMEIKLLSGEDEK